MKMKISYIMMAVLLTASFISCKKDNYAPPQSMFSGRLVYKGEPINVEVNQVPFQFFQFGFGKVGAINSTFDQDGKFSALLFDGDYKLTVPANQGPFLWKRTANGSQDSIAVKMAGSQSLDVEITPYYMIRNAVFTAADNKVTGTFNLEKVVTDVNAKNIERANLYINKTQFVSAGDYNIASAQLTAAQITSMTGITMTVGIPAISPTQNYIFARVGLKLAGVEDMIFSPVQRINF
ncbi:hypothetical protein DSL64_12730 [Dyadobacter luteus]|jgi:hypothetical protein|uniref:DUF3823 domain-containing protein n=2 Tax=Dyadobacter luteus TaxID=2259619 RepID=A0A3D8YEK9_9BACT|nr:hypothetical protein DSL64_12730 [Dyadobacter luteus]